MGLIIRRRSYTTIFFAITVTVYITTLVLFFLPASENETSEVDLERFQHSILARSEEDKRAQQTSKSGIRAFESSYVAVKPHKSKEFYEDYDPQDMLASEKERFKKYSFNELKSSKIRLDRKIPDNRQKQ